MGTDRTGSIEGGTGTILLAEAFHVLDRRRADIDHRLTSLPPEDPAARESWQELATVVKQLQAVVHGLASVPAANMVELQAKAAILSTLLRSHVGGGGQVIADAESAALGLSISDDIASLADR